MERATSFRGEMAIPLVNVVELEANTALDPERPKATVTFIKLIKIRKKSTYVYATRQPKGCHAFDEYSDCATPRSRSLRDAGTSHYASDRDTRQVPE
jgi:hypothetical protein